MKRPTTSMPMFWEAQTIIEPMTQITLPTWIERLRPTISVRAPEMRAPRKEPPGMEAEMPPCVEAVGPEQECCSGL